MRTQAEPLTVAYVAMGVANVWRERTQAEVAFMSERYEGQLNFIDEAIGYALMLDTMADTRELSAVFEYEVAEEFGERYARAIFDGEDLLHDREKLARAIAEQLLKEAEQ